MDKKTASRICGVCNRFRRELQNKNQVLGIENIKWPDDTELLFFKGLDRSFTQLENELRTDNYFFLPELNDADGETRLLESDIENCISTLNAGVLEDSIFFLKRIVAYQMRHGFWSQSASRSSEHLDKEIKRAVMETRAAYSESRKLMLEISSERENFMDMRSAMEINSTDALKRISQASSEAAVKLADIESTHSSAKVYADEIPKIVSESASFLAGLKTTISNEERNLSDMKVRRDELLKRDKEAQEKVEAALLSFSEKLATADDAQSKVESAVDSVMQKEAYFKERNKYLDDLIGREVGSSLFETFKQRKNEISGSIAFWKWSVLVAAGMSLAWIFFLFGISDVSSMPWQIVLINSVKSIPVIGLLLFAIAQYSKERNFQEEYAFKSAVALTINSYANQLDDKLNRDKLVMESVGAVYLSPIHRMVKNVESKDLSQATRDLVEVVKGLRS